RAGHLRRARHLEQALDPQLPLRRRTPMATSPPITFGGLASGLDTNTIIDKLVQIERQPITDLQTKIQNERSQKTLVGDLITKIGPLPTAVTALNTQAAVEGRAANVAAGAPFTADVTGGAPTGSYSVQVTALAQAQRTYSNAFSDPN